tara:strand:+ start:281 stop:559 length:279 start_codon:yes stop_codon:yes gene_type:complete
MFLTNNSRLKIKDIVKRISLDKPVSLEERIFVEKFSKHNSTIWTWLKKANSLRRYGKQKSDGINGLIQNLGLKFIHTQQKKLNLKDYSLVNL